MNAKNKRRLTPLINKIYSFKLNQMQNLETIDKALVEQVIEGIEALLYISDENTETEIKKLTAQLNRSEQQALIEDWATQYCFDVDPDELTPVLLIKAFGLDKLNDRF